jgi:hypothetical protein
MVQEMESPAPEPASTVGLASLVVEAVSGLELASSEVREMEVA